MSTASVSSNFLGHKRCTFFGCILVSFPFYLWKMDVDSILFCCSTDATLKTSLLNNTPLVRSMFETRTSISSQSIVYWFPPIMNFSAL